MSMMLSQGKLFRIGKMLWGRRRLRRCKWIRKTATYLKAEGRELRMLPLQKETLQVKKNMKLKKDQELALPLSRMHKTKFYP